MKNISPPVSLQGESLQGEPLSLAMRGGIKGERLRRVFISFDI
jgi:hypothetical protein